MSKQVKIKLFLAAIIIAVIALLIYQYTQKKAFEMQTIVGQTMGTTYTIKYFPEEKTKLSRDELKKNIDHRLNEINQSMSTYVEDSEISRFNRAKKDEWINLSFDFAWVLRHALEIADKTKGAYDPTVAPLVNLWGFGPQGEKKVPTQKQIDLFKKRIGYKQLEFEFPRRLRKKIEGLELDFSSIAKGYAVDEVGRILSSYYVIHYMVEIGGEVRASGEKEKGKFWSIAIQAPDPQKQQKNYQRILSLSNMALATSGDYRNFFEEGGKKYSHTIDPRYAAPVKHSLASVSVMSFKSCMEADGWATALMVLGPKEGLEVAKENGIAAYFIYRNEDDFKEVLTHRFLRFFKKSFGDLK